MAEYLTHQTEDTLFFAKKMAPLLKEGDLLAFFGEMGAGKTTFIRGLAEGLSLQGEISSPTYSLVNEYRGPFLVYHFDMYRIHSFEELASTGYFDLIEKKAILLIEWSQNIEPFLPETAIRIDTEIIDETTRKFIIKGDKRFEAICD